MLQKQVFTKLIKHRNFFKFSRHFVFCFSYFKFKVYSRIDVYLNIRLIPVLIRVIDHFLNNEFKLCLN